MVVTPHPKPDWSQDSQKHPGFLLKGVDNTPGRKAYYIHLQAKPGKSEQVKTFLRDINAGVDQEPGTGPWFALQYSETTFGIFEAFPDVAGRNDHNVGPGGVNFKRSAELHEMLEYPAHIYRLDVLHGKFDTLFGQQIKVLSQSTGSASNVGKSAL